MTEPRRYQYSLDEIKARLQSRALDLTQRLLPGGTLVGPHWMVRNPLRHDDRPGPLVNVRKGVWKDFAGGEDDGGDMLSMIATFQCGGDYKKAIPWAKDFLGLTGRAPDPVEARRVEQQAKAAREKDAADMERRRRSAFALICDAKPLDGEDPASLYLKARGIDVTKLAGGIPRALRFHPKIKALPEGTEHPAMLAFISREDLDHGFAAVHRTYLNQVEGIWTKHAFPDRDGKRMASKRVLGSYAGASVRLTRGESGKTLAKAPKGEWIAVTEGIENGLTVALAQPKMRVLCAVSLANIGALRLPDHLGGVYVVADNDKPLSKAAEQFARAVDKLSDRHELAIVNMDGEYKDANDALIGKKRSRAA